MPLVDPEVAKRLQQRPAPLPQPGTPPVSYGQLGGRPSAKRIARQRRRGKVMGKDYKFRTPAMIKRNRAAKGGSQAPQPGRAAEAEAAGKLDLARELRGGRVEGTSPGGRPQRPGPPQPPDEIPPGGGIYNPEDLPPAGEPTLTAAPVRMSIEDPAPQPQAVIGDPNSPAALYSARRQALSSGQTHLQGQQFSGQGVRDINPALAAGYGMDPGAGQPPFSPADPTAAPVVDATPLGGRPEDAPGWTHAPGPDPRDLHGHDAQGNRVGGPQQQAPPGWNPGDPALSQPNNQIPFMGYQPPGGFPNKPMMPGFPPVWQGQARL